MCNIYDNNQAKMMLITRLNTRYITSLYFLYCFASHQWLVLRQCATSSSSLKKSESRLTAVDILQYTVSNRVWQSITSNHCPSLWDFVTPRKILSNTQEGNFEVCITLSLPLSVTMYGLGMWGPQKREKYIYKYFQHLPPSLCVIRNYFPNACTFSTEQGARVLHYGLTHNAR